MLSELKKTLYDFVWIIIISIALVIIFSKAETKINKIFDNIIPIADINTLIIE